MRATLSQPILVVGSGSSINHALLAKRPSRRVGSRWKTSSTPPSEAPCADPTLSDALWDSPAPELDAPPPTEVEEYPVLARKPSWRTRRQPASTSPVRYSPQRSRTRSYPERSVPVSTAFKTSISDLAFSYSGAMRGWITDRVPSAAR